eukprot:3934583-Rhodomonas_salina.1
MASRIAAIICYGWAMKIYASSIAGGSVPVPVYSDDPSCPEFWGFVISLSFVFNAGPDLLILAFCLCLPSSHSRQDALVQGDVLGAVLAGLCRIKRRLRHRRRCSQTIPSNL